MTQEQIEKIISDFQDYCEEFEYEETIHIAVDGRNRQICSYTDILYYSIDLEVVNGMLRIDATPKVCGKSETRWISLDDIVAITFGENELK